MENKLLVQDILRLDIPQMVINKLNENSITKIGELCTQGKTELKNMGISMNDANKIEIELELMGLRLKNSL